MFVKAAGYSFMWHNIGTVPPNRFSTVYTKTSTRVNADRLIIMAGV